MAFSDNPLVDRYSQNSEESVWAVRQLFSQKNGFICRKEDPDFGVDEDVELIVNNSSSGKKFAIQIKSIENPNIVNKSGQAFISLQFETSRLGYLCRRQPALAIIVFYNASIKRLYFDYIENIIQRIDSQKGDREWQQQENININIPVSNILNVDSINGIYNYMLERHKRYQLMVAANAKKYDIPFYENTTYNDQIDPNNTAQVSEFLINHGMNTLISDPGSIGYLQQLLSSLPNSEIFKSKELLLLMVLIKCEETEFIDANFYLSKAGKFSTKFNQQEKDALDFSRYKINFSFGKCSTDEFVSFLNKLLESPSQTEINKIVIRAGLSYLKISSFFEEEQFEGSYSEEVKELFNVIRDSKIAENRKYELLLVQALNFFNYNAGLMITSINTGTIDFYFGGTSHKINPKLIAEIRQNFSITEASTIEVLKFSENKNNNFLKARALAQLAYYVCILSSNSLIFYESLSEQELKKLFISRVTNVFDAYSIFQELKIKKDVYNSLVILYDLLTLFEYFFNNNIEGHNLNAIKEEVHKLGEEMGIPEYESDILINLKRQDQLKNNHPADLILNTTDEELEDLAKRVAKRLDPSNTKTAVIIQDAKNLRFLHQRIDRSKFELLYDKTSYQLGTAYDGMPDYLIECKNCGLKSYTTKKVDDLIAWTSFHVCIY